MFVAGVTPSVMFGAGVITGSGGVWVWRPLRSVVLGMVLHGRHEPTVEAVTGP